MSSSRRWSRLVAVASTFIALASTAAAATAADDDPHPNTDPETSAHQHVEADVAGASSGLVGSFFNESSGCTPEAAGIATPLSTTATSANRALPSGHQVRGPWGDFFGRDYGDVAGSMVDWRVPMSGGKVVRVHERALPAFLQVTANLAAEEAAGNYYAARIAASWVWRRIGGSYRMSTHSFGGTIDINWDTNPYRGDNVLITDMPAWYVDAWRSAGFCWGGDWETIKDPMHFSWRGPLTTPGYGDLPRVYPPATAAADFGDRALEADAPFGELSDEARYMFADGNRDASPDFWRVTDWATHDLLIEYARSALDYEECSVSSTVVRNARQYPGDTMVADYDGDARPDVWRIDDSGPVVELAVHTYAGRYVERITIDTAIPGGAAEYGAADYNRDGTPDLFRFRRGASTRVDVWDGADGFRTRLVKSLLDLNDTSNERRWRFAIGERDVDGVPDVMAIKVTGTVRVFAFLGADRYKTGPGKATTGALPHPDAVYGLGDYDGDGRSDLMTAEKDGALGAWLGGKQTGSSTFWFQEPGWSCEEDGEPLPWDFDDDGFADLTVGAPTEDLGSTTDAGLVHVLYGSVAGPDVSADEIWHQDTAGIEGPAEAGDRFGSAVTWGDFDGDGFGDVAIGAPRDGVGSVAKAGLVNVIYGGPSGLAADRSQMWHKDVEGVLGAAQQDDQFGKAVAAGDFDNDGFDDLAIGIPREDVAGKDRAGTVAILYGSELGLTADRDQRWDQTVINGKPGDSDRFGIALAVGDFDGDGHDDLAVGSPGDKAGGFEKAGMVNIVYGSPVGLDPARNTKINQNQAAVIGKPATGEKFGAALTAADLDGDGRDDLGVGTPGEASAGAARSGSVLIFYGSSGGLSRSGEQQWNQGAGGVPEVAESGDRLGATLGSGDYDRDGYHDIAVGAPTEDVAGSTDAGAVVILYGSAAGITSVGADLLRAGFHGLAGSSEQRDRFGESLASLDVNGDGFDELAVGAPGEDLSHRDAGELVLVYGTDMGLNAAASERWNQGTSGVEGSVEKGDGFGELN